MRSFAIALSVAALLGGYSLAAAQVITTQYCKTYPDDPRCKPCADGRYRNTAGECPGEGGDGHGHGHGEACPPGQELKIMITCRCRMGATPSSKGSCFPCEDTGRRTTKCVSR
jgi:hypothetical protein